MRREVASWGRLGAPLHDWHALARRDEVAAALAASSGPGLPFGNGRSYGDVCLNPGGTLWGMRGLDRFIDFDAESGLLECEAGVLLRAVADRALRDGWFLAVTPGTALATVGGAIANDVHGKNHHRTGTFGEHVESFVLARTDGTLRRCDRELEPDLFAATVGGLGLTGVVVSARLRLRRVPGGWIDVESEPFGSFAAFLALSERAAASHEYGVAWVDAGPGRAPGAAVRGVFFRGDHATDPRPAPTPPSRRVPFAPRRSLIQRSSVAAFNRLYRWRHRRAARRREPLHRFFYPLDGLLEWNRLYGERGFFQHQSVVPPSTQGDAVPALLERVRRAGAASSLAVLKTFGARAPAGMLSFPMAGTTLAVDVPNDGAPTLALLSDLDAIVREAGGRLYPAKDARLSADDFGRMFPRAGDFARHRDPGLSSAMSRRLFG